MQWDDGGAVDGLVEFRTGDGAVVAVEGVEERSGSRLVSRGDGTVQATRTFEAPWTECAPQRSPRCASSGTAR